MSKSLWNDIGVLEYNGYRFNNFTHTKSLDINPVKDQSGRMVAYLEWNLSVESYLYDLNSTDQKFRDLVEQLEATGKQLRYEGRGLGNPSVNIGNAKDVKWGPEPGRVQAQPLGGGRGVKFSWSLRWFMPPCANGRHEFALMSVAYRVAHVPDPAGFVDRVISGSLSVTLTQPGVNALAKDSADEYRRDIVPPRIKGYRRQFGPWNLSEDRSTLEFEIRDVQNRGEQYPIGTHDASFSDSIASQKVGLRHWSGTLNATYHMVRGYDGMHGARIFFNAVKKRLTELQTNINNTQDEGKGQVIPTSFRMSNPDRFGPPIASFDLSYTFTLSLKHLLKVSGLWAELHNGAWESWTNSLGTVNDPYGPVGLKFAPGTDRLYSLCGPLPATQSTGDYYIPPGKAPTPTQGQTGTTIAELISGTFPLPSADKAWLHYRQELWVETDDAVIPTKPLPPAKLTGSNDVLGSVPDFLGAVLDALKLGPNMPGQPSQSGGFAPPIGGGGALQNNQTTENGGTLRRTKPAIYVFLRGSASRAGYEIEPPRLIEVGGVKAVPAKRIDRGEGFGKGVLLNGAHPIHIARWNLRYYLPSEPLFIRCPPIPTEGFK